MVTSERWRRKPGLVAVIKEEFSLVCNVLIFLKGKYIYILFI